MWGDPEAAFSLEPSDTLGTLLLQVSGPGHVPWNDPRWQELLHGYEVWVHAELTHRTTNTMISDSQQQHQKHQKHQKQQQQQQQRYHVVSWACASMAKHAATSSNLAALSWHTARMIHELQQQSSALLQNNVNDNDNDFTNKIVLVGKARATAGALQLLRILMHDVPPFDLQDALVYRSRDADADADRMAGWELTASLMRFLSSSSSVALLEHHAEFYDATVLSLQMLLVLLSSQLYQPMLSTTERRENQSLTATFSNYILDYMMEDGARQQQQQQEVHDSSWMPRWLLQTCLDWIVHRPEAPERSIARHYADLAESVVQAKRERMGPDGMYETHLMVFAERPSKNNTAVGNTTTPTNHGKTTSASRHLLDATARGVMELSSTILLLPFRIMTLALKLLGTGGEEGRRRLSWLLAGGQDDAKRQFLSESTKLLQGPSSSQRISDVLWLTESPIADLATLLVLLLVHNNRPNTSTHTIINDKNPFRAELAAINDYRWEEHDEDETLDQAQKGEITPLSSMLEQQQQQENDNSNSSPAKAAPSPSHYFRHHSGHAVTTSFELLFESFGSTIHTEVGALLFYTMYQTSPAFRESITVRSDLDTLVVPLLRTLYFASSLKQYHSQAQTIRTKNSDGSSTLSIRNYPFRSPSQLYVILILLLLFSQESSFGADAFRRVRVPTVLWYKERHLKNINLGSLLLLTLLRSITFNLNRLRDIFLLSNSCAVIMNLGLNTAHLHEYAALRLAAVTMACLKKYVSLLPNNNNIQTVEDHDLMSPLGMYGEVSRTLVGLLRHCLSQKNLDSNLSLVYSLVYHQGDWRFIHNKMNKSFDWLGPQHTADLERIHVVVTQASNLIQNTPSSPGDKARFLTPTQALDVLRNDLAKSLPKSNGATSDFVFSYEEEADPEIFFVPYVWEIIVCVVTSTTMEWDTDRIRVFALLEDQPQNDQDETPTPIQGAFSKDVTDIV